MEEIALRLVIVAVVAFLIGISWKAEVARPVTHRVMRVVAPRQRRHRAVTTVQVARRKESQSAGSRWRTVSPKGHSREREEES
jgi:hypothetical protein